MNRIGRPLLRVLVVGLVFLQAACDIDLFGNDRRAIVGPYGLFLGEGKFYLILDKWDNKQPCGILEGSVTELGWNDEVILANQQTCSGKPSGWMVVHVKTGMIDPPINSVRLQKRPDLSRIQVMPAGTAWDRLKRR